MKRIIEFIVTLVILAAGAYLFPESIYIKDTGALVLTTVFILLAEIVITLIGLGIAFLSLHFFDNPVIILCYLILSVIGFYPLILYSVSSLYSGFALNGIWSYIILTFVFFIFHIDVNKDK